ncbi:glycoside hydrolase superfamily [Talaromyces proteolyticus]|uniref:Probable beta-glucosidase M n=1 Tax=Talaromyces proteolyticus TaxID=1131652 RepID=A0AAD4KWD0_9EURO|nr:glycoside hydrolase superfamily [Talaromyces proteolyticus]KAH8701551.1 glycoside hydrolase superfamily [Talaromyces proteolyticus]
MWKRNRIQVLLAIVLLAFSQLAIGDTAASSALAASATAAQSLVSEATSTIAAETNGSSTSSNSISTVLAHLTDSIGDLAEAISRAAQEAEQQFLKLLDPELFYSYGGSPPVYPTPEGSGAGAWASAYDRARGLLANMSTEEKAGILSGALDANGCSGFSGAVSRLGFPGICLNDAESGVRTAELVNGYPAQIHVGASWNRNLTFKRAQEVAREFKAKGVNVMLGPVIGPLGRIAKGGRNWEGFSNDPYLAGELVAPTVSGIQQSVIACAKHFIVNEQETNRMPFLVGLLGLFNQSVSSNIDDRTMHELYLWPWYDAVKAGLGSAMCSYNRINNSYACQNSKIINGYLKTELGFQGFVVSDWYAQQTGIASANAGLDMAMPNSRFWGLDQLSIAVSNGSVNSSRLDDMVTRVLASWYRFAPFDNPGIANYASTDARVQASAPILFQSAVEGHVLVKNINGILPLKTPRVLSVFGYDADAGFNTSSDDSTLYDFGIPNAKEYPNGDSFSGLDMDFYMAEIVPDGDAGPPVALNGTLKTGGGSGAITPTISIAPYDALVQQAMQDNTTLFSDFTSLNPKVNTSTDACLVFINALASESWDRSTLADAYSDTLVLNVASQCSSTIVVIHNAGLRLVDQWIEHDNVSAVIFAHLPGQESGSSLTEILYGRQSPSGRLPYTVAKTESDYGNLLGPTLPDSENIFYSQSNFTEGLYIDYKHFIENGITPRFEFGYGLTYSEFTYTGLNVILNSSVDTSFLPPDSDTTGDASPEGGLASLYDVIATVQANVANIGNVTAAEVAQLYIGIPKSGLPKALRGFDKLLIEPGGSVSASFSLRRRDLSTWDAVQQQWVLPRGTYSVMVGKSVLDIQLNGTIVLSA